jgi:hypothetical protein
MAYQIWPSAVANRGKRYDIQAGTEKGQSIHNALIILKPLPRGVAIISG